MMSPLPLLTLLRADLFRLDQSVRNVDLVKHFVSSPCFRYVALFRICQHLRGNRILKLVFYPLFLFFFWRTGLRFGIRIPLSCTVGPGLYIGHWGGIWVNPDVSIGANCTLLHEVTLGRASRGPTEGAPEVGDRVYIGPGAKVVGKVRLGDQSLISANSLVVQNVPDSGVVMGVPGRVISHAGSEGYVTNCWEP